MHSMRRISTDFFSRIEGSSTSMALIVPPNRALMFTMGMTARNTKGDRVAPGDTAAQAKRVFEQIQALLKEVGGTMDDVIYMTLYVRDINDVPALRPIRAMFWDPKRHGPATSTIQVSGFMSDETMIEIHAIASLPASTAEGESSHT